MAKSYSDGRSLAEVVVQLRDRWYTSDPRLCNKWFQYCENEMNKWIVRDYENNEGPLKGEVRNPENILCGYGNNPTDIFSNLNLWGKKANMNTDGTNDDNNDCYFNDYEED